MAHSVSWVMGYHRRPQGERDRVGGLPDHLPHVWPLCQLCQERMEFVGQLYACDRLPLGDPLGLQFYVCDNCRQTYNGQANDRVPIHMEVLPPGAAENVGREGVRCRRQPIRYVSYTPVEDSMDQWTFNRRKPVRGGAAGQAPAAGQGRRAVPLRRVREPADHADESDGRAVHLGGGGWPDLPVPVVHAGALPVPLPLTAVVVAKARRTICCSRPGPRVGYREFIAHSAGRAGELVVRQQIAGQFDVR